MLSHEDRRKPAPGHLEQLFLDELERLGIKTGGYNLPEWEESTASFHAMLSRLHQHTRPTAFIIDTAPLYVATHQFLSRKKLVVPEDVSLVCGDPDPAFTWQVPTVSHIEWCPDAVLRKLMNWVHHISRRRRNIRQHLTRASFIEGGSIGPVTKPQ
jgi:DNA-binding LacI/PurR family transcriptional regulator